MKLFKEFLNDEFGGASMQYGLVALMVSVIAIAAMARTGEDVNTLYVKVDGAVTEASEK